MTQMTQKIDPEKEGIGMTGDTMLNGRCSPKAFLNGRQLYKRIFVRLRTPSETLTCRPIEDWEDFARRVSIIENWFNSVVRNGNYLLTFEAVQLTDEQADELSPSCAQYGKEDGDEKRDV